MNPNFEIILMKFWIENCRFLIFMKFWIENSSFYEILDETEFRTRP